GEEAEPQDFQRAEQLVKALNDVVSKEPDILRTEFEFEWDEEDRFDRFWLCSFAQPEGTIDFTQGASKRASDIILLIGIFWLYHETEELDEDDFDELMERAEQANSGLELKLKQSMERMSVRPQSIAKRILSSRDQDADDEEALKREIWGRASWLWRVICK